MNNTLRLFHTGSQIIDNPDIDYGRRNADFGGGFYLSDSPEFARKWASEKSPVINCYTLDLTGLNVKRFEFGEEWFDYITKSRAGFGDKLSDTDVIIGPIANDTLFDTFGIITSGLISDKDALMLLSVGKRFYQITVKTKKAISQLKWESAENLTADDIAASRKMLKEEEAQFQQAFSEAMTRLVNFEEINEMLS